MTQSAPQPSSLSVEIQAQPVASASTAAAPRSGWPPWWLLGLCGIGFMGGYAFEVMQPGGFSAASPRTFLENCCSSGSCPLSNGLSCGPGCGTGCGSMFGPGACSVSAVAGQGADFLPAAPPVLAIGPQTAETSGFAEPITPSFSEESAE